MWLKCKLYHSNSFCMENDGHAVRTESQLKSDMKKSERVEREVNDSRNATLLNIVNESNDGGAQNWLDSWSAPKQADEPNKVIRRQNHYRFEVYQNENVRSFSFFFWFLSLFLTLSLSLALSISPTMYWPMNHKLETNLTRVNSKWNRIKRRWKKESGQTESWSKRKVMRRSLQSNEKQKQDHIKRFLFKKKRTKNWINQT